LHAADPAGHLTRLLVGALNWVNVDGGSTRHILALHILELKHGLIFVVKAGLVQNRDTEVFLLTIRFGHLEEGVDLTDSRDVVGDEWLDLRVKVDLLGLVALNVLKHLLQFLWNGQVRVLVRVVGTWHFFLILIIIVVLSWSTLLHLLLHVLLRTDGLLRLLRLWLHVNINVHLVLFLIWVDLFGVIDIDSQVEWLVLNLLSLDVGGGFGASGRLAWCRDVGLHGLAHGVVGVRRHLIIFLFTVVELVSNFESLTAILGETIFLAIHFFCFQI
jgi:hypothetical protein